MAEIVVYFAFIGIVASMMLTLVDVLSVFVMWRQEVEFKRRYSVTSPQTFFAYYDGLK